MTELPPFPTDDVALDAVLHALDALTEVDEDGTRRLVGADYDMDGLLRFYSGTVGRDPDETVIDPGDPFASTAGLPPSLRGLAGAEIVIDSRPRYSEHDLIRALIGEVKRLRGNDRSSSE